MAFWPCHRHGCARSSTSLRFMEISAVASRNICNTPRSKGALANVTTTLNRATAPNVIVNAVAPGYTDTPAWAGVSREVRETYAGATLIGRFVMAEEIAHAAVFI